jgi:ribosomal protein S6
MDIDKKHYEMGFLLKAEDKKGEIAKILKTKNAEITEESPVSGIKLAYPIKKENFAYFGFVRFLAEPSALKELDYEARNNPDLLRHIITVYPAEKITKARRERRPFSREEKTSREPQAQRTAAPVAPRKPRKPESLTNEDLEKRLEEILE